MHMHWTGLYLLYRFAWYKIWSQRGGFFFWYSIGVNQLLIKGLGLELSIYRLCKRMINQVFFLADLVRAAKNESNLKEFQ